MPASAKDQFANKVNVRVAQTAPDATTYEQIQFAVGVFAGVAIVVHRVHFSPSVTCIREVGGAADTLYMAIVTNNQIGALTDPLDSAIVCRQALVGTGAVTNMVPEPFVFNFSDLPGGGLILPANPLYAGIGSSGFVAAQELWVRVWFTFKQLTDKDYIELIQTMLPANL